MKAPFPTINVSVHHAVDHTDIGPTVIAIDFAFIRTCMVGGSDVKAPLIESHSPYSFLFPMDKSFPP